MLAAKATATHSGRVSNRQLGCHRYQSIRPARRPGLPVAPGQCPDAGGGGASKGFALLQTLLAALGEPVLQCLRVAGLLVWLSWSGRLARVGSVSRISRRSCWVSTGGEARPALGAGWAQVAAACWGGYRFGAQARHQGEGWGGCKN